MYADVKAERKEFGCIKCIFEAEVAKTGGPLSLKWCRNWNSNPAEKH